MTSHVQKHKKNKLIFHSCAFPQRSLRVGTRYIFYFYKKYIFILLNKFAPHLFNPW